MCPDDLNDDKCTVFSLLIRCPFTNDEDGIGCILCKKRQDLTSLDAKLGYVVNLPDTVVKDIITAHNKCLARHERRI